MLNVPEPLAHYSLRLLPSGPCPVPWLSVYSGLFPAFQTHRANSLLCMATWIPRQHFRITTGQTEHLTPPPNLLFPLLPLQVAPTSTQARLFLRIGICLCVILRSIGLCRRGSVSQTEVWQLRREQTCQPHRSGGTCSLRARVALGNRNISEPLIIVVFVMVVRDQRSLMLLLH